MDPTIREVYDLVLEQWPYVAGAYAVLWVALVVYIGMVFRRLGRLEREMGVLADACERRTAEG